MSKMSYAAEILRRDPNNRRFDLGLIILVIAMIVTRIPGFMAPAGNLQDPDASSMIEKAAAIASGRSIVPLDPCKPGIPAYIAAVPLVVTRIMGDSASFDGKVFEHRAVRHPDRVLLFLGILGAMCWIFTAMIMFVVLKERVDETVARLSLVLMIVSPAGMAGPGAVSPSMFLTPLLFGALLLCVKMLEHGRLGTYVFTAIIAGLCSGFGYHHLLLVVPVLYAHFFSQRVPRESPLRLVFSARLLAASITMAIVFLACNPQLWPLRHDLWRIESIDQFRKLISSRATPSWRNLVLNNDLYWQPRLVDSPSALYNNMTTLGSLLGNVGTPLALAAALVTLFRPETRVWRPVAVYVLVAVWAGCSQPLPGTGSAAALVPALALLLSVNLLGVVGRLGYKFERTIFLAVGLALCLQPLRVFGETIADRGRENTSHLMAGELRRLDIRAEEVYEIAVDITAGAKAGRCPLPEADLCENQELFQRWARRLPSVALLYKKGFRWAVIRPDYLKKLGKLLGDSPQAARVGRVLKQFEQLEKVRIIKADNNKSIIGPTLELAKIARQAR